MQHPVETGASVVDHRVIQPVEIKISIILPSGVYRDVYQQIRQIWLRGDLLSVQTRVGTYQSMMIAGMPHEETADINDAIPMELNLVEQKIAETKFAAGASGSPSSPRDGPTNGRGQQQGGTPSEGQQDQAGSIMHDIFF